MQRSRSRKLARLARETNLRPAEHRFATLARHASIGAAVVAAMSAAHAQTASPNTVNPSASGAQVQQVAAAATAPNTASTAAANAADQGGLQEVIVTATKTAQNIQSIPMTVTAITSEQLQNENIQNFQKFTQLNAQVQFISSTPDEGTPFMRGINGEGTGTTGNQGSVGVYLNDQPITVGGSAVQWHMYDTARVETLPGPQGTLYGAQSEAGTLRIITNQPDLSHFYGSYTTQLNTIYNGTLGGIAEGFVNVPFTSNFAGRFVGWYERDSGFVNNDYQSVTFDNGTKVNNAPFVQKHFNPVTVEGGRVMFTFKINDDWSINPTIMTQRSRWDGTDAQEDWKDLSTGPAIPSEYAQALYAPSTGNDSNVDYTLTVLGKIGDFNLTYASAYMQRDTSVFHDYMDYSLAYQSFDALLPPNHLLGYDPTTNYYEMISNELRVTTPLDLPVHGTVGLYQDREQNQNWYFQLYPGLNPLYDVGAGTPSQLWTETQWLDNAETVARDWAAFAQMNWDITSYITATAGFRRYRYDNSLQGFYGWSTNWAQANGFTHGAGEEICTTPFVPFHGAPCQDENGTSEAWGSVPLFTLSFKFDPDHLVYATFSKGYRPGGPNRLYGVIPYKSDFLTNYEIGWKTAWLDHHLIFDGDAFIETWKDYQFSFQTANGIGITANAASAESKGWDAQLQWLVMNGLTFSANVSYADAYLTANYCQTLASSGAPITTANCVGPGQPTPTTPLAFEGQKLPYDAVWTGNASLRYTFPFSNGTAFLEADQSYKSFYWTQLETRYNLEYGQVPSYGLTNLSLGLDKNNWELELLVSNVFNRDAITNKSSTDLGSAGIAEFNYITPPRLIGVQWTQSF